jgi:hypothetical protein
MSDQQGPGRPPEDSPLVEPYVDSVPTSPQELDTEEILRLTQSLPVNEGEASQPAPETTPETSAPATPRGLNILAVVAVVLALTASPLTVVFGYLAVGHARRANQRGEGMAWFAVALGWLWLIAWVVLGISGAVIWFEL